MNEKYDAIVAGHICLDITPSIPDNGAATFGDLIAPGKLLNVGTCTISTGGPVSNTGIALSVLGQKVGLMGKVGTDFLGDIVYQKMKVINLEKSILRIEGAETSYTIVLAPPGIDRVFLHNPGANNSYAASDIPYESLKDARLFHLGYPPLMRTLYQNNGDELVTIFKRAKEAGVTTSLDMSPPDPKSESGAVDWGAILEKLLPYVDIFLPSIEEVCFFLNKKKFLEKRTESGAKGIDPIDLFVPSEYSELSKELLQMGAGIASLKSGHRGFYVRSAEKERLAQFGRAKVTDPGNWASRELWAPAYAVPRVVSATGSGDSSIAGFLSSFLRGETIEEALQFATAAGAQNVMVADAVSGLKPHEETKQMMAAWAKAELQIWNNGWIWRETQDLWAGPNDQ